MTAPATTGVEKTSILDMQIGDYIVSVFEFSSASNGYIVATGRTDITGTIPEVPYTGMASGTAKFYFVKVDRGLLIADRVCAHTISWDNLNSNKVIQGKPNGNPNDFNGITGLIRSLTGGVAFADANGNSSTANQDNGGWPTNNEWDKYIVNFPAEKIQAGTTLNDIFHLSSIYTWIQDTQAYVVGAEQRILRGNFATNYLARASSTTAGVDRGFRPVFEYKEV